MIKKIQSKGQGRRNRLHVFGRNRGNAFHGKREARLANENTSDVRTLEDMSDEEKAALAARYGA